MAHWVPSAFRSVRQFGLIAAGLLFILAISFAITVWSARLFDRVAFESEGRVLSEAIAGRAVAFGADLDALAISDLLAPGMLPDMPQSIFEAKIVAPLVQRLGHDHVYLVDNGEIRHRLISPPSPQFGAVVPDDAKVLSIANRVAGGATQTLNQIARHEARAAGFMAAPNVDASGAYARMTDMALVDGAVMALSAARVVASTTAGLAEGEPSRQRILVSAAVMSAADIAVIGTAFGFPDLAIAQERVARSEAFPLRNVAGDIIGWMVWTPTNPGSRLLRVVGAVFLLVTGILLILMLGAARQLVRAQQRLSEQQQMFRDIAESSSDWFWYTDEKHRFVSVETHSGQSGSPFLKGLIGLTRAQLPVLPEDVRAVAAHMEMLDRHEPFRDFVYRISCEGGLVRVMKASGKPFFDARGQFLGYRGKTEDITAQYQAELQSTMNRELLNRALVMAGQGYWRRVPGKDDVLWLSPELLKLLQLDDVSGTGEFARREILSRYEDLTPDEVAKRVREQWRHDNKAVLRVGFRRDDGSLIHIEVQAYSVRNADGELVSDYGLVRDITDEVISQQLLHASDREVAERTNLLSRSMHIARMGFWRVTNPQADPIWLSQELCELWGLSVDEGMHPLAMIQAGDYGEGSYRQHAAFLKTWAAGEPQVAVSQYRKPNGDIIDMIVQMEAERNEDGKVVAITGVVRDITSEQQALKELEAGRMRLAVITAALHKAEEIAELGHWRMDLASENIIASPSAHDVLGVSPDVAFPMPIELASNVHKADRDAYTALLDNGLSQSTATAMVRYQHPTRGLRHLRIVIETEFGNDGHPTSMFGTVQDVTLQKAREAQLAARSEALNEAQAMGRIGDWSYRLGDSHLTWSPQIHTLLRRPIGTFETTHENTLSMYVGDGRERLLQAQAQVFRTGGVQAVDVQLVLGDGTIGDFTVTSKADRDANGNIIGFIGTIQDITERKQSERDLEKLAFYDPLTGLANRALFGREMNRVANERLADRNSAALLLLDLDRFKEVNDSLGHAAGDELLVMVSQALQRVLPREAMLARLGGDEFAVILPQANRDFAAACADAVVEEVAKSFILHMGEVNIGSSVGIALAPADGESVDELMRHADLALYRAKDEGRGRACFFQSELSDVAQEKSRLARDLRIAVEANNQLELHFQPQIHLGHGRVTGFEALLRWKHPQRGYIPPAEFIPIAESSSLINDVGAWVLHEACAQAKRWVDEGQRDRTIAVNVSAAQLWHTEFEEEVARALEATGLPAGHLVLELTESVFVSDGLPRVRRALTRLKSLGVRLALDDFGTGYSSLGYLNQLPFETIKIDRCFVRGIEADSHKRELLRGIIALGQGLGMRTIAEGAESEAEVGTLTELGCDCVQGFVFGRPVPKTQALRSAEQIEERLRSKMSCAA